MKEQKKETTKKRSLIAALSLAVMVAVAVVAIARGGTESLSQKQPQTQNEVFPTSPAQVDKTDIADERIIEKEETTQKVDRKEEIESQDSTENQAQKVKTQIVNKSFSLPSDSEIITPYSPNVPIYSKTMCDWRAHLGVDFAGEKGEDIYSLGYGEVSKVYIDSKLGYVVEIDYGDFTARYCGLDQNGAVSVEEAVSPGGIIGKIATVPIEAAEQPHLHFEVIKDGKNVDPVSAVK